MFLTCQNLKLINIIFSVVTVGQFDVSASAAATQMYVPGYTAADVQGIMGNQQQQATAQTFRLTQPPTAPQPG